MLWHLIFPSFLFVIGVAMPYSLQKRSEHGQSWEKRVLHEVWRGLIIFSIGVFIDSYHRKMIQINFPVALQKIGVCYVLAFLLLKLHPGIQWSIGALLMIEHTAAYLLYGEAGSR